MVVAIYAYEAEYQGLYGICDKDVMDVTCVKEAEEIAEQMSREVIETYERLFSFSMDAEDEGYYPGTEEYDGYIEDCIEENICYDIWEVESYDTMDNMTNDFYNNMPEFIENHCSKIIY